MEIVKISFIEKRPAIGILGHRLGMIAALTVKDLTQEFLISGKYDQGISDSSKLENQLSWCVIEWFKKRKLTNLFSEIEIRVDADCPTQTESNVELPIDDALAADLYRQAMLGKLSMSTVHETLEKMLAACKNPFESEEVFSKGLALLRAVDNASGDFAWSAWRQEKLGELEAITSKFRSAKDPNHPTYEGLDQRLKSNLNGWKRTVRNIWISPPPAAHAASV